MRPSRRSPTPPPTCWTGARRYPTTPCGRSSARRACSSLALPAWLGGDGLGVLDMAVAADRGRPARGGGPGAGHAGPGRPAGRPVGRPRPGAGACWTASPPGTPCSPPRCASRRTRCRAVPATTVSERRRSVGGQDRRAVRRGGALDAGAGQPGRGRHRGGGGRPVSRRGVPDGRPPSSAGGPSTRCGWTRRPSPTCSAAHGRAVTGLYQFAMAGASCLADGALAGALALTTGARAGPGSSSAGRWPRSRRSPSRSPTSTSPRAPCTWPPCPPAGGWRRGATPATTSTWPRTGWPTQAPAALRTCHHLHGGIGHGRRLPAAPVLRAGQGPGAGSSAGPTTGSTGSAPGSAR